jgi:hypothetical protein
MDRLGAIAQLVDLLLTVLDLNDARPVTEPAPAGHLGHAALQTMPIDHRTLAGGANDEALAPF